MSNVEKQIKELNTEADALKVAYEAAAMNIPVVTKTLSFTTSKNEISITFGGQTTTYPDYERTVLTFATAYGQNTVAQLELTTNATLSPKIQRVPYSGGARWIINAQPRLDGNNNWLATTYNFTVQTAIDGTLSAKMIWQ